MFHILLGILSISIPSKRSHLSDEIVEKNFGYFSDYYFGCLGGKNENHDLKNILMETPQNFWKIHILENVVFYPLSSTLFDFHMFFIYSFIRMFQDQKFHKKFTVPYFSYFQRKFSFHTFYILLNK
jgi:hypothetical protein